MEFESNDQVLFDCEAMERGDYGHVEGGILVSLFNGVSAITTVPAWAIQQVDRNMPLVAPPGFSLLVPGIGLTGMWYDASHVAQEMKPADLIEISRVTFSHWVMASDTSGYVFSVNGESINCTTTTVSHRPLVDVAGSSKVRVNNMRFRAMVRGLQQQETKEAIRKAKDMVGESIPYSFVDKNCEYYATMWKYGRGFTSQGFNPL